MIQGEPGKTTLGVGAGDEIHIQKAEDKNEKRYAYRSKLSFNCSTHGEESDILTEKPMEASSTDFLVIYDIEGAGKDIRYYLFLGEIEVYS